MIALQGLWVVAHPASAEYLVVIFIEANAVDDGLRSLGLGLLRHRLSSMRPAHSRSGCVWSCRISGLGCVLEGRGQIRLA